MAEVLLPGLLAAQAGGRNRFDIPAGTLGEALHALPVGDLVLDEAGELRSLVNVYVDGRRERDLTAALGPDARVRVVAAIAGGGL